MTRFTQHNTEGYSAHDLDVLNARFEDAIYLPLDALGAMNDMEIKSWHDHMAEQVLADFDAEKV